MSSSHSRHTVLALGSGITLLGVMRALAQVDIEVLALPDTDGAPRRSRWFRQAPPVFSGVTAATLPEVLNSVPTPMVLMACSDHWVRTVAALPDAILDRHPASVPPVAAVDVLVDKNKFRDTLGRLGLPHPTTRILNSERDLDTVPDSMLSSSFLKPVSSQQFFARFGVKAFRIGSMAEAKKRLASCLAAGLAMMLQEYIPGPPTNHYFIDGFVDRLGVVRARFARRRLRMSPPDFGNSTSMVSVPVQETGTAASTLDSLFAALDYRGIFSAEFKRDERSGQFILIEVNARPWWYVEFAARCGVNVCELAVQDALGEPVTTLSRYNVGKRCVYPYYDLDALRVEVQSGRLGLLEAARSWLGAYQPVFRWSDPAPSLAETAQIIRRRIQ